MAKMRYDEVFQNKKAIMGMVHLGGRTLAEKLEQAKREIAMMYESGVDAVLVENYFGSTSDVIRVLEYLRSEYPKHVYGVNILGDFEGSYRSAQEYGAAFMQVDSICGHLKPAHDQKYAEMIARIRSDGNPVFVLGGVRFKYQSVNSGRTLEEDLRLGMERCDAIVVTGEGTGIETDIGKIREFRKILGDFPLIVGAGMTAETCREQLSYSDGGIVGSYFKFDGDAVNQMDPERVQKFMTQVRSMR